MSAPEAKNFETPDETREMPNGRMDLVNLSGISVARIRFEPGWRWSESVKPIAGTDSCQVHHNGYVLAGRMRVRMDDGAEAEVGPGDVFVCPAGHDAWIVGDDTFEAIDFSSDMRDYAK
jgi:mannose-6-phosphate isomerase-like protein (cupin superfamily)